VFTQEQCDRIRPWMTRGEVEEVLGVPAGDYSTAGGTGTDFSLEQAGLELWASDDIEIAVWFDTRNRVERADFFLVLPVEEPQPASAAARVIAVFRKLWACGRNERHRSPGAPDDGAWLSSHMPLFAAHAPSWSVRPSPRAGSPPGPG
jgi:hypothetical protein